MLLFKTDFDNPSQKELQDLINYEAYLVQCEEVLRFNGQLDEARCVAQEKKLVRNRKVCLKAALRQKKKATTVETIIA